LPRLRDPSIPERILKFIDDTKIVSRVANEEGKGLAIRYITIALDLPFCIAS